MAASRWMGRGDKEGADGAAVDAMRIVLDTVPMDGIVVIGEGEKDEAPMLYNGERIGDGTPPQTDIAVDPIDGTTLTSLGRGNAIAVIAVAPRGTMFDPGPCVYMEKIAVGREAARDAISDGHVDHRQPACGRRGEERERSATSRSVILDRDRHGETHQRRSARPVRASDSSPTATSPAPSPRPGPTPAPTSCSASAARPRA